MNEITQVDPQNELNNLVNNMSRNLNNREQQLMNIIRNSNQISANPFLRNLETQRETIFSFTFNKETFRHLLNTQICFVISLALNAILLLAIIFLFLKLDTDTISLETLEDDGMFTIYILSFLFSFIAFWNFYLFFSLIVFKINFTEIKIDDLKKFNSSTLTIDILYFNPGTYCFVIYTFYKHLFPTNLDLLIWHLISSFYFINFIFTNKLFFYSKLKVKYISNKILINDTSHKLNVNRVRWNQIFLILLNVVYVYFIAESIKETDFIHKYLLIGKVKRLNFIFRDFIYFLNKLNFLYSTK